MDEDFKCKEHKEDINIVCESCDKLMCYQCLDSHSKTNCKYPISLVTYATERILPRYKVELEAFEKEKETFAESLTNSVNFSMNIKKQLIQLKQLIEGLMLGIVAFEKLTDSKEKISSYYDMVRDNFVEELQNLEDAIICKNVKYILKSSKEESIKKVSKIYGKQKDSIEIVKRSMENLFKSQDIELMTKGLQDLYTVNELLFNKQCTRITNDFLYGVIEPQDNFQLLCKYDIKAKKLTTTIPVKHKATITQIRSRVFISGGMNPETNAVNEYIENTKSLVAKASMAYAKALHAIQVTSTDTFISVGGYSTGKTYAFCEEYSIYKNQWVTLAPLNCARHGPGTLLMGNKFMYVIGGWNSNNKIEKLDLSLKKTWVLVNLGQVDIAINISPKAFPISDNEAIVFGGSDTEEIGIYNVDAGTLKKTGLTSARDRMFCANICSFGASAIIIGFNGTVTRYNLISKKVDILPYTSIYP